MPIDYKNYPKNWKTEIRPSIMKRAKNRCEICGVRNYSVGSYQEKKFVTTAGNLTHDAAGRGELPFKEASELVKHCNEISDERLIVIVLTIAHLDHNVSNNDPNNLKALCQRCHNRHDVEYRKANRKKNRGVLFLFGDKK